MIHVCKNPEMGGGFHSLAHGLLYLIIARSSDSNSLRLLDPNPFFSNHCIVSTVLSLVILISTSQLAILN